MYTVVGTLPVTRSFRVLWALEELNLSYTINPLQPGSDEVKAINPSGKVPVLVEGDTAMPILLRSSPIWQISTAV